MVISDIHTLAEEMGARRLRVDRSGWAEEGKDATVWFEVGYAGGEIHIRTSTPALSFRRATEQVGMDEVIDLFDRLLSADETEVPA